jgi:hypothetical protein
MIPKGIINKDIWSRAEKKARERGKAEDLALIMQFYKDMGGLIRHRVRKANKIIEENNMSAEDNLRTLLKAGTVLTEEQYLMELLKAGKRDLSKLQKKIITDKRGHKRTVWVKKPKGEGAETKPSKKGESKEDHIKGIAKWQADAKQATGKVREQLINSIRDAMRKNNIKQKDIDAYTAKKEPKKEPKVDPVSKALEDHGIDKEYHKAVTEFLGSDFTVDEITDVRDNWYGADGYVIDIGGQEWLVTTQDGARESAEEDVRQILDDMGVEGFNRDFVMNHIDEDRLGRDLAYDSDHEYDNAHYDPEYVLDEGPAGEDGDWTDEQRERAGEQAQDEYEERVKSDPMGWIDDAMGIDEFFGHSNNLETYLDEDSLIKEAVDVDGEAHFISRYDGNEVSHGDKLFYRLN